MTTAQSEKLSIPGIKSLGTVIYNPGYEELFEFEKERGEGTLTAGGTMSVDTGKFTGRSPKDKYFVEQSPSKENIWWGPVNKGISPDVYSTLKDRVTQYLEGKDVYVIDAFCGANPSTRINVRIVARLAWQAHFCKNMFIRPTDEELKDFEPDFTILNASEVVNDNWQAQGLNSEVFVAFNLEEKMAIIGGTSYGGEMKKGIFSIMHYYLPLQNILSMHCSANVGTAGDAALFFGLSGTGKTTLSTDPNRKLIGDDEHGWDDEGIFNFEGGCYAKTIDLKEETEPDIYRAIRRDALLENVMIDAGGRVDYADSSKTENGRVSYPLYHIDNIVKPISKGMHPNHILFLTCDAFGVLPPVSKLTRNQAMYHFISGYTAKVAGTERGVTEPQATFSPCFGGPFLTQHPHVYAKLLGEKIDTHKAEVWLINTGWTGGPYGVGSRMSLPDTRKIITAILNNELKDADFIEEPVFGIQIPSAIAGVSSDVLNPASAWSDMQKYSETIAKLAGMFVNNYNKYKESEMDFSSAGPKA